MIYAQGHFQDDDWRRLSDEEVLKPHSILSLEQFQARPNSLGSVQPLGLFLEPGSVLAPLLPGLVAFDLIALNFPKYTDGRAYSLAHQMRQAGFKGHLRACGEVLFDQLQLMIRCGFDSFEISHKPTLALLESGHPFVMDLFYQQGLAPEAPAGTRPWIRHSL